MQKTPKANRTHISIYGKRNAGKSSLLNAIIGQDISIVSEVKGTTTDPVEKTMELIPYGPVVFIDTAGLDDTGNLGQLRVQKSMKILQRTDFAIYVMDANDLDRTKMNAFNQNFEALDIPHMIVINKVDTLDPKALGKIKTEFTEAVFTSVKDMDSILTLKDQLIASLEQQTPEPTIVGDLLNYNDTVVMVVPIDSEAPKGRIILPQVQMIRDCLDHGIKSYVVRDTELEQALKDLKQVDLVITDSQAFKRVNAMVPKTIPLTSFSILFARYKSGDLKTLREGIEAIDQLDEHAKVLISESCTHNFSHEDIGRVKIPQWLENYCGQTIDFDFKMGHDFPTAIEQYDLIIHCGGCMVNPKTFKTRVKLCREKNVPITNYGLVIAYFTNILNRSVEIVENKTVKETIN